jgi:outer membrane protein
MNVPIFNGYLYQARAKEADYQSEAAKERVRALRNQISRDVKTAVLNAQAGFQRIGVTEQMFQQANLALDLAQTRYKIGLGTIVELSQAQLQQTEAEISKANALYMYESEMSVLRYQTGQ